MNFGESLDTCIFNKYHDFKGTASRSEFWWFYLVYIFIVWVIPVLAFILTDYYRLNGSDIPMSVFFLMIVWLVGTFGLLCPFLAVSIRRLHDIGKSGWNFLWTQIPYIGFIIMIILMSRKSNPQTKYINKTR